MENLAVSQFQGCFAGRRVLLTGHTGFKGSWLSLWLTELGARVTGLALAPETDPNHWDLLRLRIEDRRVDVRDATAVCRVVEERRPEIVFHFAAQPLVLRSYREPRSSWDTNVMGTVNLLEACRLVGGVRAIVVVTTDKVYANKGWARGYRENDRLGGHDPYSASKAAAEFVIDSYRKAFFHGPDTPLIASARAGNVIGGADWSEDRLIPDLVRAVAAGKTLEVRSPEATRPWQHVLECLNGYLLLGQRLLDGATQCACPWNFGPEAEDNCSVADVLASLRRHWAGLTWDVVKREEPHEASFLYLDNSKSKVGLGWRPVWGLDRGIVATAAWYRAFLSEGRIESRAQLKDFVGDARAAGCVWAGL